MFARKYIRRQVFGIGASSCLCDTLQHCSEGTERWVYGEWGGRRDREVHAKKVRNKADRTKVIVTGEADKGVKES